MAIRSAGPAANHATIGDRADSGQRHADAAHAAAMAEAIDRMARTAGSPGPG
jgi:hypothetical protein